MLGFALLGLLFSGWSALVHYRLLTQPDHASPCSGKAVFSCSDTYLSRFGSVGGVPIVLPGIMFFAIAALLAALGRGRPTDAANPTATYIFTLSTAGLAAILYLAWASWFVLERWCLLCLGTYVSMIGLFVTSGLATSVPASQLPRHVLTDVAMLAHRPAAVVSILVVTAVALALLSRFPRKPSTVAATGDRATFAAAWIAQPRIDLGIPAGGATVLVVKFMDWHCGACRSAYLAHRPVLSKYEDTHPGAVKSVTKDYPLSSGCNANISSRGHKAACEAAAAVRLAAEHGQEQEMIDWLFANLVTLTPQSVETEVVRRLGITSFPSEYARLLPAIQRDIADASALRVDETPTYYVNGRLARTPGAAYLDPRDLDWAIQYELANRRHRSRL